MVKIGTDARGEFLNTARWTYDDQSVLPHGSKKDGNAALQPIWLTSGDDNPNNAKMIFLVDGAQISIEQIPQFDRVLNLFDGADNDSLFRAREFWKQIKQAGIDCFYWQQDNNGNWQQKA